VSASYPTPEFRRTALAPGILAAIVCIVGTLIIGTDTFVVVQYVVAILALIVAWFAFQAKAWWFVVPLVVIAVLFNPVFPVSLDSGILLPLSYLAALVFIASALLIKIRNPEDRNRRTAR
jgi:hypothetical protein